MARSSYTEIQSEKLPAVSVIIPVHGEEDQIVRCLEHLANQDFEESFEVVLGADEDKVPRRDTLKQFSIHSIGSCSPGAGPGGARNAALALAQGDIFLFTDADCLPDKSWVRKMTEAVRERNGRPVRGWCRTGRKWNAFHRASDFAETGMGKMRKPTPVHGLAGSNMACGRKWYDFGARFAEFVYGGEETAFLSQLDKDTQDVVLYPEARVIHDKKMTYRQAYKRLFKIGIGSGICRKRISMRGSFFARHPSLIFLLVPARATLAIGRMFRCTLRSNIEFIALFPLTFLLWCAYTRGFVQGVGKSSRENER